MMSYAETHTQPKNSTSSPREKKHYALDVFCISVLYLFVSMFCTFLYLCFVLFRISVLYLFYIPVLYFFISPSCTFLYLQIIQMDYSCECIDTRLSPTQAHLGTLLSHFCWERFQRSLNINCGKVLTVQCESVNPTPKRRNKDKWNCKQAERCWYSYCVETFLVVVGIFRMGRSVPEHLLCLWKTWVCP